MNKLPFLQHKSFPYIAVSFVFLVYMVLFALYHDRAGFGIASLAVIPVIAASWYFGVRGGTFIAILSILVSALLLIIMDRQQDIFSLSNDLRIFILILIALITGKLGTVTREHSEALVRLEASEKRQQAQTNFLELLNQITAMALEADNLDSTFKILVERISKLFKADDGFFALWDETREVPLPTTAYGSMSDIFPYIQFEPGERTPTTSAIEIGSPIAIVDLGNSPYIDPKIAAIFPSHSMLALPLIVHQRNLGAILLGYNKTHLFDENDLAHAQVTAEQTAQVLAKSLLLEEERKRVKQLTALHDISQISIEVDNEDELINGVTDIIGQNLFPDNFGILLLDEVSGILKTHPSYRFFSSEERDALDMPIEKGITGQVARTGKAQRIGNVRRVSEYIDMDDRTISELCVPIKFKEQILGVINAESTKRDAFTVDDERLLITLAGQIATAMEQIRKAQAERKWLDQLAHSNDLIYSLAHITTHIEKALDQGEIIKTLGTELNKINLIGATALFDSKHNGFVFNYTSMPPQALAQFEAGLGYPITMYTFSLDKLKTGSGSESFDQPVVIQDPQDELRMIFTNRRESDDAKTLQAAGFDGQTILMRLPLVFEDDILGILWVWGAGITKADLPIMSIFAKQIGVSLERARLFQEVQSLALTDPLTGLQNRRSLFELGRVEFARAHRMNRAFCCMMLDLDHFKKINDTYGHPVGDLVLREFAKCSKTSVREVDLVARYGGEELIILLPETDRNTAMQVAERLRASIAATPIKASDKEIAFTVSISVAAKDENTLELETLIARADQAMYIAKHKGRNCVAMSK